MARRSRRLAAQQGNDDVPLTSNTAELAGDNEETSHLLPQEERNEESAQSKNSKKRKTTFSCETNQVSSNKRQRKRDVFSDMPYDILLEIFTQLNPIDLLNLMRTSKDLRAFLRNRSNQMIWKAARSNIRPKLPICPDDLSEPQYADLAFGKDCNVCLRLRTPIYTVWDARIRICKKCLPKKFSTEHPRSGSSSLWQYVPRLSVEGERGRYVWYYFDETEARYLEADESGSDAMDKLVEDSKRIHKHAAMCEEWESTCREQLAKERAALVESRMTLILERLRSMGWEENFDEMVSLIGMKKLPDLVKACQAELTEDGISTILAPLTERMKDLQKKWIRQRRFNHVSERIRILQEIFNAYALTLPNSLGWEFPKVADLFCHPEVRDLIDNVPDADFTVAGLQSLRDMLPRIVSEVKSTIHDKVVALVAKGYAGSNDFDPGRTLELATTVFSCNGCNYGGYDHVFRTETIRYSDVVFHQCTSKPASQMGSKVSLDQDVDFYCLDKWFNQCDWNRHSQISFKPENKKIISDVVALAGFDPKTTTSAQMDAADPIYECISCNSPERGRATMRWSTVIAHHIHSHSVPSSMCGMREYVEMKLEVLCGEEAQDARDRLDELIARDICSERSWSMSCGHCLDDRTSGHPKRMKEHVRSKHGILHPTDDDIVPRRDRGKPEPIFFMWPPREA